MILSSRNWQFIEGSDTKKLTYSEMNEMIESWMGDCRLQEKNT